METLDGVEDNDWGDTWKQTDFLKCKYQNCRNTALFSTVTLKPASIGALAVLLSQCKKINVQTQCTCRKEFQHWPWCEPRVTILEIVCIREMRVQWGQITWQKVLGVLISRHFPLLPCIRCSILYRKGRCVFGFSRTSLQGPQCFIASPKGSCGIGKPWIGSLAVIWWHARDCLLSLAYKLWPLLSLFFYNCHMSVCRLDPPWKPQRSPQMVTGCPY